MIKENTVVKYFLYAIGEIVLVVIGILIALQLNIYYERLIQNDIEQQALYNLKVDFDYNEKELDNSIERLKDIKNSCLTILRQTGDKYQETFDIDSLLQFAPSVPQYYPQNGFLMDLINSGKLGIIKNVNLRNRLFSWLPNLETLKNREDLSTEYDGDLIRYVIKIGSWLNSDQKSSADDLTELKSIQSGFNVDNNALLQHVEFENMIENQIVFQSQLLEKQEQCAVLAREIIELLKTEME
jgi:hypothetical protein